MLGSKYENNTLLIIIKLGFWVKLGSARLLTYLTNSYLTYQPGIMITSLKYYINMQNIRKIKV